MKKYIILAIFIIVIIVGIYYNYDTSKRKDLTYVIEHRLTTGWFNKYKLSSVSSYQLTYSDEVLAIVYVNGIKSTSPHNEVSYKVLLEKQSNGTWKVKDIYVIK